jgi:hypothetical protein
MNNTETVVGFGLDREQRRILLSVGTVTLTLTVEELRRIEAALSAAWIQQQVATWEDEDAAKRAIAELVDDLVRWLGEMVTRQLRERES